MPNALWIWDVARLRQVALIVQQQAISSVHWSPTRGGSGGSSSMLAFATGGGHLYLWASDDGDGDDGFGASGSGSGGMCEAVEVPAAGFAVQQVRWSACGAALALMDRDKFLVSFVVEDEGEVEGNSGVVDGVYFDG
ncbi:hypothetical protein HK405_002675 [Cladochytrium tenue]|nr:hypothetical protein HK405_002675 [Cladochytrium tenue]